MIDRHTGALLIVPAIEEWALLQQEEPILAVVVVVAIIRMRIYVHGVPLALLARANCRCLWNAKVIYEFPDMLNVYVHVCACLITTYHALDYFSSVTFSGLDIEVQRGRTAHGNGLAAIADKIFCAGFVMCD